MRGIAIRWLLTILCAAALGGCQDDEAKLAGHLDRGDAYLEDEEYASAIIEYKNVLQINPNRGDAHWGLARAYLRSKQTREGFWELRETARLDPSNLEAKLQFGQIAIYAGELDESLAQAEEVIAADPSRVTAYLLKGRVLEALRRPGEAQEAYEQALEVDSESAATLLLLATEFVSANPTGPLTIAHGRQAALGDSLVRILKAHGCDAQAEYYNNDVGVQIRLLGESLYARCLEHSGKEATLPEQGYRGEYLKTLAEELLQKKGDAWLDNAEEALEQCQGYAREEILKTIKKDLEDFNVQFDRFYSQEALDKSGEVEKTLEDLKQHKAIYEKEGAVWFRSTSFGDDKDRVVVKSDSSYTYLMPDIAYHRDKFHRGFQEIVDILGPDHHGYIARLKGSQEALGYDPSHIRIIIAQLVTLYEGKKQLKMSTRAGEFVTLRELLENVGKDAARYFFLLRNADTHLDFDLELAKSHTPNNPVFYIQYAHARVSSINRMLLEKGVKVDLTDPPVELLKTQEEVRVLRHLRMFPKAVAASANQLEPHILGEYLEKLAALFHQFYQKHRVITDDLGLTAARILLVNAIQIVTRNGLSLLGVSAPESM